MPTASAPFIGTQVFSWPRIVSPEELQGLVVQAPPGLSVALEEEPSFKEAQGLVFRPPPGLSATLEFGDLHRTEQGMPRDDLSTSQWPVQRGKRWSRRVCFSDEVLGGRLAEVFEVASFKEFNWEACQKDAACTELGDADQAWCTGLVAQLEGPDIEMRKTALLELDGLVLVLSLTSEGSQVVQRALEVARCGEEQEMLAVELYGHVQELSSSPHGSEVLQSCLEVMKPESCRFIPGELQGHAVTVACQEHGCEVLCRLVEHMVGQEMESLMKELLQHCTLLCQDEFGNAVVEHILEYGSPSQQMQIRKAITKVPPKEATLENWELAQKTCARPPNAAVESVLKRSAVEFVPITTLMVRGIPCGYSQEQLLQAFDDLGFRGQYDFFYLPRKSHQSNLGYAFVNFVDMEWASRCCMVFNGRPLDATRSKKVCSVCPAHIQGLENLRKHFSHTCVGKSSARGPMFTKNVATRPVPPQVNRWPALGA